MPNEQELLLTATVDLTVEMLEGDNRPTVTDDMRKGFAEALNHCQAVGILSGENEHCVTAVRVTRFDADVRRGFRLFVCPICRSVLILPTRDHTSPSVENCIHCTSDVHPERSWPDARLPVNQYGNLTLPGHIHTLQDFEAHIQPPDGTWCVDHGNDTDMLSAVTYEYALEEALSPSRVRFAQDQEDEA